MKSRARPFRSSKAVDALVAMVWDGKVVVSQSGNSGYYPRTSVGVKADGTVVLFQADGTMAPAPSATPPRKRPA